MHQCSRRLSLLVSSVGVALAGLGVTCIASAATAIATVADMPPVVDASNLYSEAGAGHFSATVADALPRIYVPNLRSNDVYVIDPVTFKVVGKFHVGYSPQHVVPSWDLKTLWVANNAEGRPDGSLTPIDPRTGKPGKELKVDDPYNMYFTPDGKEALVVAEAHARLDFRDPHTMALKSSMSVPECKGINHADLSIDGRYALFTCEFGGKLAKIDLVNRKVIDLHVDDFVKHLLDRVGHEEPVILVDIELIGQRGGDLAQARHQRDPGRDAIVRQHVDQFRHTVGRQPAIDRPVCDSAHQYFVSEAVVGRPFGRLRRNPLGQLRACE